MSMQRAQAWSLKRNRRHVSYVHFVFLRISLFLNRVQANKITLPECKSDVIRVQPPGDSNNPQIEFFKRSENGGKEIIRKMCLLPVWCFSSYAYFLN